MELVLEDAKFFKSCVDAIVNLVDNAFLDPGRGGAGYAVFGAVSEGMTVVDAIAKVPTGRKGMHEDVPVTSVVVKSAKRLTPKG